MRQYQDLITIFNACFTTTYHTKLVKGGDEPIYLPADENRSYHEIIFANGFFSSALHECAHWLIAGNDRRKQVDFGYWYAPDGRTAAQQALFQRMEARPQAMEWILSQAAGYRFRISIDNINGEESDTRAFGEAIYHQVEVYCQKGLSPRAQIFHQALCSFYNQPRQLIQAHFQLETLYTF